MKKIFLIMFIYFSSLNLLNAEEKKSAVSLKNFLKHILNVKQII